MGFAVPTKNGDLKPTDFIANSNKKVWWLCKKGHEWQARISNRMNGNNCPYCANKKVLYGYNDLSQLEVPPMRENNNSFSQESPFGDIKSNYDISSDDLPF
mgnify:CR=1 FL=1